MCGICGMFGESNKNLVERMNSSISHRGPDDEGYYLDNNVSLGIRRLSIVDRNLGKQPMFNEEGNLCIIFNGEIYNYRELREFLIRKNHRFDTYCDTEIILHLFEEYGKECPKYLDGIFAFAIYDLKEKELFLARDRLGIKPLYYYSRNGRFLFGSEIKAIFQDETIKRELNIQAINETEIIRISNPLQQEQPERYCMSKFDSGDAGYFFGDLTYFKDIFQLSPGSCITVSNKGIEKRDYWKIKMKPSLNIKKRDLPKGILYYLTEAVKRRIDTDIPVGVFLSGGVDSSTLVAILNKLRGEQVNTFTFADEEYNPDVLNAKIVSETFGTNHKEIIISPEEVMKELPYCVLHNESSKGLSAFYFFYLSKVAKNDIKIALCGQGAEELFAPYELYKNLKWYRKQFTDKLKLLDENSSYYQIIKDYAASLFSDNGRYSIYHHYMTHPLSNFQLPIVDRGSMAFGVEARVPYLDINLLNHINEIPLKLKLSKYALVKVAEKLGVPKKISNRIKRGAGWLTLEATIKYIDKQASSYVGKDNVKKEGYEFFRTKSDILCFNLLKHIFIENNCKVPKNFDIADLF